MSPLNVLATVLITLALIFYSVGVWSERIARYLKPWHVVMFWLGLLFDASGTYAMDLLEPGIDWTSMHTITAKLALWLMFAHAVWATIVVRRGDEATRTLFHRLSVIVWLVWLVPYIGGMFLGMTA
jgi:uncharacterized repeat protein (TIGR03987 family)